MASVNPNPKIKVFRENINWKWVVLAILSLLLIGAFQAMDRGKVTGPKTVCGARTVCGDCVKVPAGFTELKLPYQAGCWEVQLDPERFSGKVYFPPLMSCALDWNLKTMPAQIMDVSGQIKDVYQSEDFGRISPRNSIFQFRGNGSVRIYIEPKSR